MKLCFAILLQFEPHISFNDIAGAKKGNFWWETLLYLDCTTFVMPRNALSTFAPLTFPTPANLRQKEHDGLVSQPSLFFYSEFHIFPFNKI